MPDTFSEPPWHLSNLSCNAAFCDVMPEQGIDCCDDSARVYFASLANKLAAANSTNRLVLCRCTLNGDSGSATISSASDHSLIITHLVVLFILILASAVIFKQVLQARATTTRQSTTDNPPSHELHQLANRTTAEDQNRQNYELCARHAKAALLTSRSKDIDEVCAICLEVLGNGRNREVVCLPNCCHRFHRGCITEWIEQVRSCALVSATGAGRDEAAKRMLSCPVCARPIVTESAARSSHHALFRGRTSRPLLRDNSIRTATPPPPNEATTSGEDHEDLPGNHQHEHSLHVATEHQEDRQVSDVEQQYDVEMQYFHRREDILTSAASRSSSTVDLDYVDSISIYEEEEPPSSAV